MKNFQAIEILIVTFKQSKRLQKYFKYCLLKYPLTLYVLFMCLYVIFFFMFA